jgi:hypothetical protein
MDQAALSICRYAQWMRSYECGDMPDLHIWGTVGFCCRLGQALRTRPELSNEEDSNA